MNCALVGLGGATSYATERHDALCAAPAGMADFYDSARGQAR